MMSVSLAFEVELIHAKLNGNVVWEVKHLQTFKHH